MDEVLGAEVIHKLGLYVHRQRVACLFEVKVDVGFGIRQIAVLPSAAKFSPANQA